MFNEWSYLKKRGSYHQGPGALPHFRLPSTTYDPEEHCEGCQCQCFPKPLEVKVYDGMVIRSIAYVNPGEDTRRKGKGGPKKKPEIGLGARLKLCGISNDDICRRLIRAYDRRRGSREAVMERRRLIDGVNHRIDLIVKGTLEECISGRSPDRAASSALSVYTEGYRAESPEGMMMRNAVLELIKPSFAKIL